MAILDLTQALEILETPLTETSDKSSKRPDARVLSEVVRYKGGLYDMVLVPRDLPEPEFELKDPPQGSDVYEVPKNHVLARVVLDNGDGTNTTIMKLKPALVSDQQLLYDYATSVLKLKVKPLRTTRTKVSLRAITEAMAEIDSSTPAAAETSAAQVQQFLKLRKKAH